LGPNTEIGPWFDVSSSPLPIEWTCLSDPMSWGATEAKTTRFRIDSGRGSGSRIREYVLRFDFPDVAAVAARRLSGDLVGCPTGDDGGGTVEIRGPEDVPGVPDAERFWIYRTRTDGELPNVFDVATARRGAIVVVLQYTGRYPGEADGLWAWSPQLLSVALDRGATGIGLTR
jgi:hypothetical protein